MISQKVCLVGSFAVGKTSLISQFVHSIFSDTYLSTVGVKISKKILIKNDKTITLVLWDLEGKDCYTNINTAYLRGMAAFFVVADITRKETLEEALVLRSQLLETHGDLPNYLLINKVDLLDERDIHHDDLARLDATGISYLETSAKLGLGVEEAFHSLVEKLL